MPSFIKCVAVFMLHAIFFTASVRTQDAPRPDEQLDEIGRWKNGVTEPWFFESKDKYTNEDVTAARSIWKQIEDDADSSEWAGTYSKADGEVNMTYLRWSPRRGFVRFHIYTCLPDVRRLDYGKVNVTDSYVEFVSARSADTGNESETTKYVKAKWGEQYHLVPEDEIGYFFNYTSGRGEIPEVDGMRQVDYFSMYGDWDKPTADVPTVAAVYAEHVKKPIDARITKVGKRYKEYDPEAVGNYELVTPITLNIGSNNGFKRGMTLYVVKSKGSETVELTRVGRTTAQGIIVREMRDADAPPGEYEHLLEREYPPIEVGWQVSTSPHKQQNHN